MPATQLPRDEGAVAEIVGMVQTAVCGSESFLDVSALSKIQYSTTHIQKQASTMYVRKDYSLDLTISNIDIEN